MGNFETYKELKGVIFDENGTQITNGIFEVVRYRSIKGKNYSSNLVHVKFTIVLKNTKINKEVEIPLADIKNCKIYKYIPDEFIFYIGKNTFQENFLRNKILYDLRNIKQEREYVLEQGHNQIGDKHMFCLGNCVVNPIRCLNNTYVSSSNKILKNYAEDVSYIGWINNFCELDKDTMPVLLLSVIVAIIRPLLKEAGTDTLFVPYIYGETGKGKSTYAKLLTDIFKNGNNHLTFSSDITNIREVMVQVRDFVVLIDDLNSTSSPRVKASKESKVSEIIQQAANGDIIKYKGTETYFEGLLFITAEYVLKNVSTINRCILLNMLNEIDIEKINYLKEKHGLYVRFLKDFIRYIYNGHKKFVMRIKDLKESISVNNTYCRDAYKGIVRLEQTEKTLMVAFNILIDFFKYSLKLPDDAIAIYKKMFENSIRNCVDTTKEYIRGENSDIGTMYIKKILELIIYERGDDFYSDIPRIDYKAYRKRKNNGENPYYFVHDGYICFTGEDIINYFSQLENFKYAISKKAISEQLNYHNLLRIKGGERSYPCNACKNKTRYYHIDIRRLLDFADDYELQFIRNSWLGDYLE
ncbi:MAG: DUF927 domain-containing protein [Lachnospiraceae bacterium]|nr:DUF927 domain-containing protein [Lachnospiraceae bacterium]